MNYHTVLTSHFADRYAPSPPSSEMPPNHRACAPALALLQELAKLRVLKVAERTCTCTCNQCAEAELVATAAIPLAYTARDPTDPALGAVLRLLQDTRTLPCALHFRCSTGYSSRRYGVTGQLLVGSPHRTSSSFRECALWGGVG